MSEQHNQDRQTEFVSKLALTYSIAELEQCCLENNLDSNIHNDRIQAMGLIGAKQQNIDMPLADIEIIQEDNPPK